MKESDNVFCLSPKYFCPSTESDEDIETFFMPWHLIDEPVLGRIRKRYKNRRSNFKLHRTEKKKRKRFAMDRSEKSLI